MPEPDDNPYAAPAAEAHPPRVGRPVGCEDLKDPRTLGVLSVGFVWLYVVCVTVLLIIGRDSTSQWSDGRLSVRYPAREALLMFSAAAVTFLMWTHRCAVNARRLERNRINTTPWLAVVSYFIPIYHLVGPCIAMKEIIAITYRHIDRRSVEGLVPHWWLGWIGFSVSSWIMDGSEFWWFPLLCMAISAVFLTMIVLGLSAAQAEIRVAPEVPDDGHSRLRHSPLPGIEAGLPLANLPRHRSHAAPGHRRPPDGEETPPP
ncbi:hypothetical protein llg_10060 [Luteolibacter sp. LG18]|nr:hypothetical protein llg_10060 [Luteolibacter sp. LG18]